ncbi:MAG: DUF1801 domain-containing protein [Cyclobacteriaceae bacterium]
MDKQRKPLSTKKAPTPSIDYKVIEEWMANRIMPSIQPIIKKIDSLIHESIPKLNYAIKWGNAYYGTNELGWLIEVAAYDVSVNIVFLSCADFDPKPPLGNDERSRYIKVRTMDELNNKQIIDYIEQASRLNGWK